MFKEVFCTSGESKRVGEVPDWAIEYESSIMAYPDSNQIFLSKPGQKILTSLCTRLELQGFLRGLSFLIRRPSSMS